MPVQERKYYQHWVAIGDYESRSPISIANSHMVTYIQFDDLGYEFVIANCETGETFNFIEGNNFEFTNAPLFEYNKSTKQMRQCEPTLNAIL